MKMRRMLCILAAALTAMAVTSAIALAAGDSSRVHVSIVGQALDEAGEPLEDFELLFGFDLGEEEEAETRSVTTDRDGIFELSVSLRQSSYVDSSLQVHCTKLQGYFLFDDNTQRVDYWPGEPQDSSDPSSRDRWADSGRYTDGNISLFRSLRTGAPEEDEPDFQDLDITLGSAEDPCVFEIHRTFNITEQFLTLQGETLKPPATSYGEAGRSIFTGEPPQSLDRNGVSYSYTGWYLDEKTEGGLCVEPAEVDVKADHVISYIYASDEAILTVQHVDAADESQMAAAEIYVLNPETLPELVTRPLDLRMENKAPLTVWLDDGLVAEAEPGDPIEAYTVVYRQGEIELTYYYDLDRDGDGIPDHLVGERYRTEEGNPIENQPDSEAVFQHKEIYKGQAANLSGTEYKGYTVDQQEQINTGLPQGEVTKDVTYTYIFGKETEKKPGGGGGTKEPNEPEPPEPELPEPPEPEEEIPPEEEAVIPDQEEPPPLTEPGETEADPVPPDYPQSQAEEIPVLASLTEEEREALRNVTFAKRGNYTKALPGDVVAYTFTGFENAYPYPVKGFVIMDRPDKGLDFHSLDLPGFQNGSGVTYDVTYITNRSGERKLAEAHRADIRLTVESPELSEREYITAIVVRMDEVPAGFGVGDEIVITFQIWEEPPEEVLHNKGTLFYEESGEAVECQSDEEKSTLWVDLLDRFGSSNWAGSGRSELSMMKGAAAGQLWKYVGWTVLISVTVIAIRYRKSLYRS